MKLSLYKRVGWLCLLCLLGGTPAITGASEVGRGAMGKAGTMPKQCRPGKTSAEALGWRWRAGTAVRIQYLADNFEAAELTALSRAVDNWNTALAETSSGVVFLVDEEDALARRTGGFILVRRGVPRGKERVGELTFHSLFNGGVRLAITISPVVTDLEALTSLMTHELGHSLGLADCYECRRGTTAMAAFKSTNKGNDVFEPSECDRYVVAAGYLRPRDATDNLSQNRLQ
jgi:hypothetical protein